MTESPSFGFDVLDAESNHPQDDQWLTTVQMAELTGIDQQWLKQVARTGQIPAVKIPRKSTKHAWLISRSLAPRLKMMWLRRRRQRLMKYQGITRDGYDITQQGNAIRTTKRYRKR